MEQEKHNEQEGSVLEADEATEAAESVEAPAERAADYESLSREELIAALIKAQEEADDFKTRSLRVQADFDNFRRRSRQEKEEFAAYANTRIIEELLPVIDTFDMALKTPDDADIKTLLVGVQMVHRQLMTVLENQGVQSIEAFGQPFDPNFHEGIMQVESDEHPANTVVEELRKGYRLKDRVIRPSMVKVSQ